MVTEQYYIDKGGGILKSEVYKKATNQLNSSPNNKNYSLSFS